MSDPDLIEFRKTKQDLNRIIEKKFNQLCPDVEYGPVRDTWFVQNRLFAIDTYNFLVKELVKYPQGSEFSLLDVGAGPGIGTSFIGGLFGRKEDVGYQLDCHALELSAVWEAFQPYIVDHVNVMTGNLYDLDDRSYDIVICSHVIEHLEREEVPLFIRKMTSVARKFTIVTCPWKEGKTRHPTHLYSVEEDLIDETKPDDWQTYHSLGWKGSGVETRCLGMTFRN